MTILDTRIGNMASIQRAPAVQPAITFWATIPLYNEQHA